MKKKRNWISLALINFGVLIFFYIRIGLKENYFETAQTWLMDFSRVDIRCIYWIMVRISIWFCFMQRMFQLESGFTLYLFLRNRSFNGLFFSSLMAGIVQVLLYFFMLLCGTCIIWMLGSKRIIVFGEFADALLAYGKECIVCIIFCLLVYLMFCVIKNQEISFVCIFIIQIMLKIKIEKTISIVYYLVAVIIIFALTLKLSAKSFYNRIGG